MIRLKTRGPEQSWEPPPTAVDTNKIDEAVVAPRMPGRHGLGRAWKGFKRDALDRLYERDLIHDLKGNLESVLFTKRSSTPQKLHSTPVRRARPLISGRPGVSGQRAESHIAR